MIAINNELINTENKNNLLVRHYLECTKFIKDGDLGKKITLKYPAERITPANPNDPESRPSKPEGFDIPMSATMTFDGRQATVTYYEQVIPKGQTNTYRPSYKSYNGYLVLDPDRDVDLIYFLIFCSPFCSEYDTIIPSAKGDKFSKYQNPGRRKGKEWFKVENRSADAQTESRLQAKVARAQLSIYDEINGVKDKDIKLLGLAYGIFNVENMSEFEVRVALANKILRLVRGKYDEDLVDEFLKNCRMDDKLKIKAKVLQAEREGAIRIDRSAKKDKWMLLDDKGEYKTKICEVPVGMEPHRILVEFLTEEPEMLEILEKKTEEVLSKK